MPCKLKSCILILTKSMELVIFKLAYITWSILKLDAAKPVLLTCFKVSHEILTSWYNQFSEPIEFIIYKITSVNKFGLNKLTIPICYFYFWNILFADLHQIFSRGQIPKEMYQEIANLVSFKILRSLFLYYLKNFLNIYLRFYTLIYQCLVF